MGLLLVLLIAVSMCTQEAECAFGDPIDDKVEDVRFRKVGRAYVDTFNIEDNTVDLSIVTEDTIGVDEIWVVDFEPYDIIPNSNVIDSNTGDVIPENSGECSNILNGGTFIQDTFSNGILFNDDNNITPIQYTEADLKTLPKKLFMSYSRGGFVDVVDVYNENVTRREYQFGFSGDFEFFFNCTNRLGNSIWSYDGSQRLIEFKATVYFTNVRPVVNTDGTKGMSYVSSSANLYYRIYRIAMVNFILSSQPLVKPSIDFVIISPYVPVEGQMPVANAAKLEIRFRTTIESPTGELLIFEADSIEYEPEDNNNTLNEDFEIAYPSGPQPCDNVGTCEQLWNFELVLDVKEKVVENNEPIDATGIFRFKFKKHQCSDATTSPTGCVDLNEPVLTISMEVTIQTVVTVVDSETDKPRLVIVSLTGFQNDNLRLTNGGDVRGVNHRERVKYKISYTPEFLYSKYGLRLTLFMVCKGVSFADEPEGCLAANVEDRYIAYYHDDFEFSYLSNVSTTVSYNTNSLSDDPWSPYGDNSTQQELRFNGPDPTNEDIYRMDFINTALSMEREYYVITTVFKLVPKENTRRRRGLLDGEFGGETTLILNAVPAKLDHHIKTRSIEDSIDDPADMNVPFEFTGCPANTHFILDELECECTEQHQQYSDSTFQCENTYWVDDILDETEDTTAAASCTFVQILSLILPYVLSVIIIV
ncbi:uncharacterized protein LOC117110177 [Anneissia japonica]|uniref:uncharacterized protein LOC117110177 n=1 Tax=Anneissia japonica TaxID=1529436 RepID=UPI00142581AD|nr:uncharacterized protein LOC117110177 [Anneissia japonica]